MVTDDEQQLEPGEEDAGLEPLGRYSGRGLARTMRTVFDVLYEADRPLDIDTIAERTFERVPPAARYHAHRRHIRDMQRTRKSSVLPRSVEGAQMRWSWRFHVSKLVGRATLREVLIRDDSGYRPNPGKPPRVQQADGTLVRYTRDAWLALSERDRTIGELQTMRMEVDHLLSGFEQPELDVLLELAVAGFAGRKLTDARPADPKKVRRKARWLLERPTTDASRAWFLHELVRRRYGEQGVIE